MGETNKNDILNGMLAKVKSFTPDTVKTASDNSSVNDSDLINELRKQADEAGNTQKAKAPETFKPRNDSDDTNTSAKPGVNIKTESEGKDENISTKKTAEYSPSTKFRDSVLSIAGVNEDEMSKTASEEDTLTIYDKIYRSSYELAREAFKRGL